LANTPADETVECDAIPIDPVITATDNCDSNVRILFVEERTNGICEDNFVLTRTWTASDNCGNSTTRQQTITIIDSTSPVLANIPADVTVECDAIPSIPPNITATDNCDADVEIELSEERTSSDCEDSYILTRTYIATDNCGNTTQAVQVIVVQDITPPILMNLPADLTFNAEEGFDTTFPIATDNCDANVDLTVEDVVNATETEIVRTFRATDNCGNFTAAEQIITIIQDGNNLCDNISISTTNDAIILSNVDAPNQPIINYQSLTLLPQ